MIPAKGFSTWILGLALLAWIGSPGRADERFPTVLNPSASTYQFPQAPDTSASAAPAYLHQLLPILKQAIRARLTVLKRLNKAAGDANRLERVLQEYAGQQQLLLRQLSRLSPPAAARAIQREVVQALYFQLQFFRHFAAWLYEDPRHRLLDEISDSRLQGCHQALERIIELAEKAFPRLGQEERRVFREHVKALELF